ncbi:MAG: Cj0069 family protein [Deltaproteobacteria bacterium]|nr:Cj0069 family protein [Deltaproteobacteria bacterium]
MPDSHTGKVAILYPGDYENRQNATPENNRLAKVFQSLSSLGVHAEPAVYNDQFSEEVHRQLIHVDVVLVWMNPIQDGHDRTILDSILREIASTGIFVSAHPDIILKMGTKEVLYQTRELEWGCETHLYHSMEQLCRELPIRLSSGKAHVLKQYRGNGGDGVWKVETEAGTSLPTPESIIRVRHAKRGSVEEKLSLNDFFKRCKPYFAKDGRIIDQIYQPRLFEGMIRCYLVHDKIVGFGHQAVNALFPAPPGKPPSEAPPPGPRLYHPPSMPDFQALKNKVEQEWVPAMQRLLGINTKSLPILWDCDFLLGPMNTLGEDTYVLCEINVSSVAPFPESAPPYIAEATLARLKSI